MSRLKENISFRDTKRILRSGVRSDAGASELAGPTIVGGMPEEVLE